MSLILSIDPATSANVGVSILHPGKNVYQVAQAWEIPMNSKLCLAERFENLWDEIYNYLNEVECAFIEDTLIRGKGNNDFYKFYGMVDHYMWVYGIEHTYIHNMTVKKFFDASKRGSTKETLHNNIQPHIHGKSLPHVSDLIKKKQHNALDAIAIGIAGYETRRQSESN
jgi:Holliday junction resolvasome RuvABC endonuclease subunit